MKAILEIDAPNSCWDCMLCYSDISIGSICVMTEEDCLEYSKTRRNDCPLKITEGENE